MTVIRKKGPRSTHFSMFGAASLLIAASACGEDAVTPPVNGPAETPVVTTVHITPSARTMGVLGTSFSPAAGASAQDGSHMYGLNSTPEAFAWSSSAPEVAIVDERGLITSVGEGVAAITATVAGVTDTITITVTDAARLAWTVPTGGQEMRAGITIGHEGTIYATARSGLFAISPEGEILWSYGTPAGVLGTPAIGDDGTIYFGSLTDGGLTALGSDRTVLWQLPSLGSINSAPAIGPDGTIYVAGGHYVHAVDPDGEVLWSYESEGTFNYASPSVANDGTLYVGGTDELLHAINADGSGRWTFKAGDPIQSSPSIGTDGTIYFGSHDERLYAVNPDGTQRWRSDRLNKTISSSPSIAEDGTIYVGADGLFAFDPSGSMRWRYEPRGVVVTTPILGADGSVYVVSAGRIHALDAQGALFWDYDTDYSTLGSPAMGLDGKILSTTDAAVVVAITENKSMNGGYDASPWPKEQGSRANTGRPGG